MRPQFLADHCVPMAFVRGLRAAGYDVVRVCECMTCESDDVRVLAAATSTDRVLLSLNGDFADIVAFPPAGHGGVVAIQLKNRSRLVSVFLSHLLGFLNEHDDREFFRGLLLVLSTDRVRLRR